MSPRKPFLALLLLALLLPTVAGASDAAVRQVVADYAAAREARDVAALEALLTEDADQLVSAGIWRHGRAALVEGMLASSRANPGSRALEVTGVRFLAPEVAVVDARYEIAGAEGRPGRQLWSTFVIVEKDGRWRIAAIRNMQPGR